MQLDPNDQADPSDSPQWVWRNGRWIPEIFVRPRLPPDTPPAEGIDNGTPAAPDPDGGPNDWIAPKTATDDGLPDDWFLPSQPSPWSAEQTKPGPQPSAANPATFNPPPAPPDPFAAFWSLIPASHAGAMAWHPPIFPDSPAWSPPAPAAPSLSTIDASGGLLGGIPKILAASPPFDAFGTGGLLGGLAHLPKSPAEAPSPFGFLGQIASVPPTPTPFASSAFPPSPPTAVGAPLDALGGLPGGSSDVTVTAASAAPQRSVLFRQPPSALDLGASDRVQAAADPLDPRWAKSGSPLAKSGAPLVLPPPELATSHEQALAAARFLAPNLTAYFNDPDPPPAPLPSTPGKIPSEDNPHAGLAAIEAASLLFPFWGEGAAAGSIGRVAAGALEGGAADAANQLAKAALDRPTLLGPDGQLVITPYKQMKGRLLAGWQAHHLNQTAAYGATIARDDGLTVPMRGNIFEETGTSHHTYHQEMEDFWEPYREDNGLSLSKPTNAEYGDAARRAYIAAGLTPAQASELVERASAERIAFGLKESSPVPRVPGRISLKK